MKTFLQIHSRRLLILLGFILTGIAGLLDYATGEFPFTLFYLVPICLITWFTDILIGIMLSFACSLSWFFDKYTITDKTKSASYPYWNAAVIFGLFIVVTIILSALKKSLEKEKRYARNDYLTGAQNRGYFAETVSNEMNSAREYRRPLSVAYIDIDNFRQVNDTMGHSVGDQLLCRVAALVRDNIRKADVVARLGSDEFAILLPETPPEQARTSIIKLRSILLEGMSNNRWPVTFSIGLVTFAKPPSTIDKLFNTVVTALSAAKKNGGGNIIKFVVVDGENSSASEFILPG
jgi:diguanylate cyclase (GGDEF)-like protein